MQEASPRGRRATVRASDGAKETLVTAVERAGGGAIRRRRDCRGSWRLTVYLGRLVRVQCASRPPPRNVVAGAMNALAHLHRLGFCHLHLHPGAILIATNDAIPHHLDVRLSFFENAKKIAAPDDSSLIPFFGQTGVPGYRSPEAIIGTAPYGGPSADIYSMGCMALGLILGRETFKKAWLDVKDQVWDRGARSKEMQSAWIQLDLELADHEIQHKRFLMQPSTVEEFATDYVPAMLEQEREAIERAGALEFLSSALFVNPADRPTAEELLLSPWLSHRTRSDEQQQPGDQESQGGVQGRTPCMTIVKAKTHPHTGDFLELKSRLVACQTKTSALRHPCASKMTSFVGGGRTEERTS